MSQRWDIRRIAIIGAPLAGALAAAMIAARLPGCEIDFIQGDVDVDGSVYTRPNIRHVHQILQITEDELIDKAGAEMVLALPYASEASGAFRAPLGDYGHSRGGCDFQHYWQRAHVAGQAEPMEAYNLALRLDAAGCALAQAPKGLPMIDPAYRFDGARYAALLLAAARARTTLNLHDESRPALTRSKGGVHHVKVSGRDLEAELILDIRRPDGRNKVNEWTGHYVSIAPDTRLSGLYLYRVQTAITRLFSLWPDLGCAADEAREYNRLTAEESAHIDDMTWLLSGKDVRGRDRLARKVDLFRSRGRVAAEDYDFFSRAEWIAALRALGSVQTGHDRLADRGSLEDITHWLAGLSRKIDAQVNALKG